MDRMNRIALITIMFLFALSICIPTHAADKKVPWQDEKSPLRFKVGLTRSPNVESAGYIVTIPDGGILPGPDVVSLVMDEDGNKIDSYTISHSVKHGFVVLFEKPAIARTVYVYVRRGKGKVFTEASGLTPSLMLFIQHGRSDMSLAKRLKFGKTSDSVLFKHYGKQSGTSPCDVSYHTTINGAPGQERPFALHMSGYLKTTDPGKTWIVASSYSGTKVPKPAGSGEEVYIDGQRVTATKTISDKPGGKGMEMNLKEGLHKFELFVAGLGRSGFGLTWRTPNTTPKEMGGIRNEKTPHPGTPQWETRTIKSSEVALSGKGTIRSAESKDGGPVAIIQGRAMEVFWFFVEDTPQIVFGLKALREGNPEDTVYTWEPISGVELEDKPTITWMYPGYKECMVKMKATANGKTSTATLPIRAYSPEISTDLNDSSSRAVFRQVYLNMIQAYPENVNPTETWDESMWSNLFATLELGKSNALLLEIFGKRWDKIKKGLSGPRRWKLEDAFYEWLSFQDPKKCILWLQKIEKNEKSAERKKELKLMRAEVYMYGLKDFKTARKIVGPVMTGAGEMAEMARVRMGDIELLSGSLNNATKYYGMVQNRTKIDQKIVTGDEGLQWGGGPVWKQDPHAVAAKPKKKPTRTSPRAKVDEWKQEAVLDTAASETVKTLIDQGFLLEARNTLDQWERYFPMSKIDSDYIIHEANFHIALKNHDRARATLEAYCKHVDASSYVPAALELLLDCMLKTKASDEEVKIFCKDVKKQFSFHPLAQRLDSLLEIMNGGSTGKREATSDR